MTSALKRAIEAAGGTGKLAAALGIKSQAVSQWRRVPGERVIAVERATGGAVTRHELRPDLYPADEAAA
jgi:DNA-binding transcriptional regulator YdaS (Cro superfamily)